MVKIKRVAVLVLVFMIALTVMGGCGPAKQEAADNVSSQQATTGQQATTQQVKEEPTPISIMTRYWCATQPDGNNLVLKELEKATNTKLTIDWTNWQNYNDKVNLALASGDLADMTYYLDPMQSNVRSAFAQGVFWDLTDKYKDYKTLSDPVYKDFWTYTKATDGKNYILPRFTMIKESGALIFRSDLVEAAGMKLPTTSDELYNVLKTVCANNPGYAGMLCQMDTSGTTPSSQIQGLINLFTKSVGLFKVDNGKIILTDLMPEKKEGIAYVKKLYDEKLINEDFAVTKDINPIINSGKWVVCPATLAYDQLWLDAIKKTDPNTKAVLEPGPPINGVAAKNGSCGPGVGINKKTVDAEKLKKILQFCDDIYDVTDEPGKIKVTAELPRFGINGVDFTIVNGKREIIQDAYNRDFYGDSPGNSTMQLCSNIDKYAPAYAAGISDELYERNKKAIDEMSKVSIADPMANGLYSETGNNLLPDYYKKSADLITKIILGKEPMSSWDKYVSDLKADATLAKIQEELTASYNSKVKSN